MGATTHEISASEKREIIALVERSHLPVRRTLDEAKSHTAGALPDLPGRPRIGRDRRRRPDGLRFARCRGRRSHAGGRNGRGGPGRRRRRLRPPDAVRAVHAARPLRDYADGDFAGLGWLAVGSGIRQVPLNTRGLGSTARFLSIPTGKSVPDHGHRGFEATLVLAGSFYDRDSWYRRGDVAVADPSVVHRPAAESEEDCICLAATDARLKFRVPIPRLLQPFHGI